MAVEEFATKEEEIAALNKAVDDLAAAMKAELLRRLENGWAGWQTFDSRACREFIRASVYRGTFSPVDLANWCAFYLVAVSKEKDASQ